MREPKSSYFSCYRTDSRPVLADDMNALNEVFDTCEETDLLEMLQDGAKILKSGKYQLSFTALMKSTGSNPLTVELTRVRPADGRAKEKLIGRRSVDFRSRQGYPEVGLSASIFMMEELEENDMIKIVQTTSNGSSFLRSSDWNLLRLEGHLAGRTGNPCYQGRC